jgi:hypothetical protein
VIKRIWKASRKRMHFQNKEFDSMPGLFSKIVKEKKLGRT